MLGIGLLLPEFVKGQRQANDDNWSDLKNYNDVQMGQIENAYAEGSFYPRLQREYYKMGEDYLGLQGLGMDYAVRQVQQPGMLQLAAMGSALDPLLELQNKGLMLAYSSMLLPTLARGGFEGLAELGTLGGLNKPSLGR